MGQNNDFSMPEKELEIFREIQFFRLTMEVEDSLREIEKNETVNTDSLKGLQKFFTSIGNSIKNSKTEKLSQNKLEAEKKLDQFLNENPFFCTKNASEDTIRQDVNLFFGGFTPMMERERFAVSVIMDNEYSYIQNESHDKAISRALFSNETQYEEIKKRLEDLYREIAKKPLSAVQKGAMIGIGALSAATLFLFPVIMAGGITAAAPTTTAALAAIGFGDMQVGIGMLSLYSALLGGAAMGITYKAMEEENQDQLRREFCQLNFDEAAKLLAIRALFIERSKFYMNENEIKENISDLLELIDDFRSDTSYELFVEHSDIAKNRDKIQLFHNFDKTMIKVCGV